MRKILISAMVIGLVCALIGAGVYAVFSDTETSTGNTFTAGTLNLVPSTSGTGPGGKYTVTEGSDGVNGKVVFEKLAPGDSGTITWSLTNTGSVDGLLTLTSAMTFTGESINEPECIDEGGSWDGSCSVSDPSGDLGAEMKVWLSVVDPDNPSGRDVYGSSGSYAALSGLKTAIDGETSLDMDSGEEYVYKLSWKIPTTVDNIIQSDKAALDITFALTQS